MIVRKVAPESNACEHHNVPVVHARSTAVAACVGVDIIFNEIHHRGHGVGLRVHLLQRSQNRNDAVSTFQIQRNSINRQAVQSQLG